MAQRFPIYQVYGRTVLHGGAPKDPRLQSLDEKIRKAEENDDETLVGSLQAQRRGLLNSTEEGKQQLADEKAAVKSARKEESDRVTSEQKQRAMDRLKQKDPLAWAAKQVGDTAMKAGPLVEKGVNELLKAVGVDEKDANRITDSGRSLAEGNLGALKDLGQAGVKEVLKRTGVNAENAEKISGAVKNIAEKGSPGQEGIDAAKSVALSEGKKLFDKGVENRKKLVEKAKKDEEEAKKAPVIGSAAMPAEVNVNIKGLDANAPVPAQAVAAAAGAEIATKNIADAAAASAAPAPPTATEPVQPVGSGKRTRELSGDGLISDIRSGKYSRKASNATGHAVKKVADVAEKATEKAIDTFGYADYDAKTAAFLRKHGSTEITSLVVRRAPVGNMLNMALNAISAGSWNTARTTYGYDSFFHLGLIINEQYITQRLSRVTVTMKDADMPNTEFMPVNISKREGEDFTLKSLLQTTSQRVGKDAFFKYDAFKNNCQNFVLNILTANGLSTPALQQFILQDIENLVKAQPAYMAPVTNTLTNLGQITGAGKQDREG